VNKEYSPKTSGASARFSERVDTSAELYSNSAACPCPQTKGRRLTEPAAAGATCFTVREPDSVDGEFECVLWQRSVHGKFLGLFFANYVNSPSRPAPPASKLLRPSPALHLLTCDSPFYNHCVSEPPRSQILVEIILNPNWWNRNYGISFNESFYFDKQQRIQNDLRMRTELFDRFGIGEPNPVPRPIIGSQHVAGGFVVPALLGVQVRFLEDQAPWPIPLNLSREEILALKVPKLETTWPMDQLLAQMDELEKEFGYVVGDFNTGGIFNTSLELRGQQLFIDLLEDEELVKHLFAVVSETQAQVAEYVKLGTGTTSVATNRSILNVEPKIYVNSNCSVQMVSPGTYEKLLFPFEFSLAERLRPYGIHHCGDNLHRFAKVYAKTGAVFYDVGWGSDVAKCSEMLPQAFLNLRLNPVRMLRESPDTIRSDTLRLLSAAGRTDKVGVCCINMDYGTPDQNIMAMFQAVRDFSDRRS